MPKLAFDSPAPYTYASPAGFDATLSTLAQLGFHAVEIGVADPARLDLPRLRESLARTGMALAGVLTGASYFEDGLCLISPDDAVRTRAVARLEAHVDWTAPFNATVVVGQMQGMRSDEPDRRRANERLIAAMRQVAAHAEACGGHVVLEAVNRHEVAHNYTAAEVLEVVEAVDSPAFDAMLDTYHINIEECSLDAPVRLVGRRLGYLHVVENHRGRIGSGHLDLAMILRTTLETGYTGYWAFGDFYGQGDIGVRAGAAIDYLRRHNILRKQPAAGSE